VYATLIALVVDLTWNVFPYSDPWERDPPDIVFPILDTISSGVGSVEMSGALVTMAAPSRNIAYELREGEYR